MNVGLDTSVLLRLLIGSPPDQARTAVQFLDDVCRSGGKVCVSDLVVAETYFALQFHYGIAKGDALAALAVLLSTGEIVATGQAGRVLTQPKLASARPGFVDRLIHAAYTESECKMATFEKAAGKLSGAIVLK
jgi:predicted nucleic-acid-binding protein